MGTLMVLVFVIYGCAALRPTTPTAEKQSAEETTNLLVAENQEDLEKLLKQNRELQEKIGKLEQKLTALNERMDQQKADIKVVQEQWETNFVLLEQSVAETLASVDQSTGKAAETVYPETGMVVSQQTEDIQSEADDKSPTNSGAQETEEDPLPVPPLETYTLIEPTVPKAVETDEELAALNNLDLEYSPPEDEDPGFVETPDLRSEDLEETEPLPETAATAIQLATNVVEKPDPILVPEVPKEPAFQDPDLNDPEKPIVLIRHPGVKKIYNQGMTAVIQRNYEQAIRVFENFVQRFPDDMDSDNAYYWIGHSYFQLRQFEKAEATFRKILTEYEHRPTSQGYKTPEAIYMLGKIHEQRGFAVETKYYFREVASRYPGSAAAKNAQRDLKGLP